MENLFSFAQLTFNLLHDVARHLINQDVVSNISSIAVVFASSLIATNVWMLIKSVIKHFQYQKALRKEEFKKVIGSYKIDVLGGYLYQNLGKISVYEYAKDGEEAEKLHKYLSRIADMLSADEDGEKSSTTSAQSSQINAGLPDARDFLTLSQDLRAALNEIKTGEVWNGLARVRRDLEIKIFQVAEANKIPVNKNSLGSLLMYLGKSGIISEDAIGNLRWALSIANRAIHGNDISRIDAEEAFWVIARVYESQGWLQVPSA